MTDILSALPTWVILLITMLVVGGVVGGVTVLYRQHPQNGQEWRAEVPGLGKILRLLLLKRKSRPKAKKIEPAE